MTISPTRKEVLLQLLHSKYDEQLVSEYVLFAENRAGKDVWQTFATNTELYHDIELFRDALAVEIKDTYDD